MTDGGALLLAFSRLAAELRAGGLVTGTITAGQAFGGDLEAISLYSALAAARAVLAADVVVVAQGPGGMGRARRSGSPAPRWPRRSTPPPPSAAGRWPACGCRSPTGGPGTAGSATSLTALGRLAPARAAVAVPELVDPELAGLVDRQLAEAGVAGRHDLHRVAIPDPAKLLASWGIYVTSMGRGPGVEDSGVLRRRGVAAGTLAGRLARA